MDDICSDSLDEILGFIALDSPEAASKVLDVVLAAAESLSLFSERGRVVPETDTSTEGWLRRNS